MDHRTTQRIFCVLSLFAVNVRTSSFDLQRDENIDNKDISKDIPEDIRTYLATFEKRILRAVDTEFKRQLSMIRARIDYRIPSLLDLTLTDRINSGFINKAMDDALVRRVEKLEDVILLRDYTGSNRSACDEVKSRMQESQNELQRIHAQISVELNTTTAAVTRLDSEIKHVKSTLATMDSKVKSLDSNITAERGHTESSNLSGIKFELENLNTTFDRLDSEIANFAKDVHDLKSEIEFLKNNDKDIASELKVLRTRVQRIDLSLSKTISDVRENTDNVGRHDTNLLQIEDVCNTTIMGLGQMRADVEDIRSAFNQTNENLQAKKEAIFLLNTTVQNTEQTLERGLDVLKGNLTMISSKAREISNQFLDFGRRVDKIASSTTDNRNEMRATKSELTSFKQNITLLASNVSLEVKKVFSKLRTTSASIGKAKRDVSVVRSRLDSTRSGVIKNTGDIKTVQSELRSIRAEVEKANSDTRGNRLSISSVQSKVNLFSGEINTVKSGIASLKKDIKFEVRLRNAPKTILKGSILKFDKVQYNTGSGYNSVTGHFKAPVAGSYLFWANVLMYASSSSFEMSLTKNGVRIAASAASTCSSSRFDTVSLTAVTELDIGDVIWFKKVSGPRNRVSGHRFSGYGGMLMRTK